MPVISILNTIYDIIIILLLIHVHVCVYRCMSLLQAEQLFERLNQAKTKFINWVVLGSVDLDNLVDQHCHQVPDWERNFKALKARGREAEKLPK